MTYLSHSSGRAALDHFNNDIIKQSAQICNKQTFPDFHYTLQGTIIPSTWKSLCTKEGKKLSRGALELYAIIVSWHNPKKNKDKETGKVILMPKFEGDELRKNYAYFTKELGVSQEQVRRYFIELKRANLVSMELRTIWHKCWRYPHTLCIKLNKEAPHFTNSHLIKNHEDQGNNHNTTINQLNKAQLSIKTLEQTSDQLQLNSSNYYISNTWSLKKIYTQPHQKVGLTPPKSGVYISNNYLKTSNIIRSEKNISDFANSFFSAASFEGKIIKANQDEKNSEENFNKKTIRAKNTGLERKPLIFFHPLTEMDAIYLRKASKRPFSLNFINKLLLKLSGQYPSHGFYKKTLLLSYLAKALTGEKYDAEVASNETFKFKPKEGTLEHKTNMQSNYLKTIEQSRQTDPITKIKQKIIGQSAGDAEYAYYLITNTSLPYIQGTLKESSIAIKVLGDITTEHKETLTKAVKEVMGMQTFIIFKDKENKQNSCITTPCTETPDTEPELSSSLVSSSPLWQKVRSILKQRFGDKGEAIDKTWFARLDIELKAEANTNQIKQIFIKCPSLFVKDWIKTNYDHEIESAVADLALTTKEISIQLDRESQISQETESETTILQPETLLPIALNPNSIKNLRFEYVAY